MEGKEKGLLLLLCPPHPYRADGLTRSLRRSPGIASEFAGRTDGRTDGRGRTDASWRASDGEEDQ